MRIRNTTPDDLPKLLDIYEHARVCMRQGGNPNQWGSTNPPREYLEQDLQNGTGYVIEDDGRIIGTFAFIIGEDPTYKVIENGSWLNDEPYGTIHRIAAAPGCHGVFEICLEYCSRLVPNIRIDTHRDNAIMLHLIERFGFQKCGIIYIKDGTPRIAFQKEISSFKK